MAEFNIYKKAGFGDKEAKHLSSLSPEYIKKHNERAKRVKAFDKSVKRHSIKMALNKAK